jgi:hypothetical protein
MFARSGVSDGVAQGLATQDFAVPHLADLIDILDVAPETVSRAFASMREQKFLADQRPQMARLRSPAPLGLASGMVAMPLRLNPFSGAPCIGLSCGRP